MYFMNIFTNIAIILIATNIKVNILYRTLQNSIMSSMKNIYLEKYQYFKGDMLTFPSVMSQQNPYRKVRKRYENSQIVK